MWKLVSRILPLGLGAVLLAPFAMAAPVELAAHRAAYEISFGKLRNPSSSVIGASGGIIVEMKKTCGGWAIQQDHSMRLHLKDGNAVPETIQFSSWESDDGKRYRFALTDATDGEGNILGSAAMPNGEGKAIFRKPEAETFVLQRGTLFPLMHSKALLAHARDGANQFTATVFEGTALEGEKLLVAFINPLKEGAWRDLGPLLKAKGWTVRLAYFDPKSQSPEPLYEVEADFLDNGVSPRWLLDYGDFTVEMKIKKIETLSMKAC